MFGLTAFYQNLALGPSFADGLNDRPFENKFVQIVLIIKCVWPVGAMEILCPYKFWSQK